MIFQSALDLIVRAVKPIVLQYSGKIWFSLQARAVSTAEKANVNPHHITLLHIHIIMSISPPLFIRRNSRTRLQSTEPVRGCHPKPVMLLTIHKSVLARFRARILLLFIFTRARGIPHSDGILKTNRARFKTSGVFLCAIDHCVSYAEIDRHVCLFSCVFFVLQNIVAKLT